MNRVVRKPHSGPAGCQGIRRPTGTRPRLFARVSGSRLHTHLVVGTRLTFGRSATDGHESIATVFRSVSL